MMRYWVVTNGMSDEDSCSCDICYGLNTMVFTDENSALDAAAMANAIVECDSDTYHEYSDLEYDEGILDMEYTHAVYGETFQVIGHSYPDVINVGQYI
jgi:hypothetical protein